MTGPDEEIKRYIAAALSVPANHHYKDQWSAALSGGDPPRDARLALAILANLAVNIDEQLDKRAELSRERIIELNNDLWCLSDAMEEIVEGLRGDPQRTHAAGQ